MSYVCIADAMLVLPCSPSWSSVLTFYILALNDKVQLSQMAMSLVVQVFGLKSSAALRTEQIDILY